MSDCFKVVRICPTLSIMPFNANNDIWSNKCVYITKTSKYNAKLVNKGKYVQNKGKYCKMRMHIAKKVKM